MTPLYFGPANRRLFGVFHSPAPQDDVAVVGVLLCNPFGQEAIRVHRMYRVIAERLSRLGVGVLRFDYFGAGDSAGDDRDGEMNGWASDIVTAHAELSARLDTARIAWIGLRLGATLVLQAAQNMSTTRLDTPRHIVLWDPVASGVDYGAHLARQHLQGLRLSFGVAFDDAHGRDVAVANTAPFSPVLEDEALGFSMTPTLREQFTALTVTSLCAVPCAIPLTLLAGSATAETFALHAGLTEQRACCDVRQLDSAVEWATNEALNSVLVPPDALRILTERVEALR